MLFEVLEGSVEDMVETIIAAEFCFISTLVLEKGPVLDFALEENLEKVRQLTGKITIFFRAESEMI